MAEWVVGGSGDCGVGIEATMPKIVIRRTRPRMESQAAREPRNEVAWRTFMMMA